jgi:uncharacterized protein YjlB
MIRDITAVKVTHHILADDGTFPNNDKLSLLVYHGAVQTNRDNPAAYEQLFKNNDWSNSWRNGIFDYHHYHSTSHEVLGIYGGTAEVIFGGPDGTIVKVQQGDVVIIPAGVAHNCLKHSTDFKCVGAYPNGKSYDINTGKSGERPKTDENIRKVPVPELDPVYGKYGPLLEHWVQ